jgi:membrane fusion protein (multidrug efflux system)
MRRAAVLGALAAALAIAAGGWALQRGGVPGGPRSAAGPAESGAAAAQAAAPLEFAAADVVTVAPVRLVRSIPLTGTLRPVDQTVVRAKVPGELRDLAVREGMAVRRGQAIGRIESADYETRVRERAAQLQAAESQVDQARRTFENTRRLHEREFVSQSALDQARSALEIAVGNRDAAREQLVLARKALGDVVLVAPIDGVVAERFAQPGEKLPIDGRVVSIVNLARMEIEAPVPAAEVGSVTVGQPVELRIEGVAQRHAGRIVRIAPTTQAGTRSVPVYIALDNRDPAVRAGLFAQGSLAVETRDGVLAVPQAAVRDAGARTFVYAIVDGRLVERDVKLGLRDEGGGSRDAGAGRSGEWVEVTAGLAAGERIVAVNLGALRVGSPVRIAPGPGPGDARHGVPPGAAAPAALPPAASR